MKKYQKIKTCTEMALEAGLPCGKDINSLRSNNVLSIRKEGLFTPFGTAISAMVAGYENKERSLESLGQSPFLSVK